ncbi:hypothetical protein ACFPJ4_07925 [Lysinimonas soli]|uniref:Phage tail protein n=1 Tax=Lysinimonas soli TaxID=1074233 RepID=A0ABW0NTG3_9MICO
MHAGPLGRPRWEVVEDASRDVLVALYLRDALGIVDPSGLPRMLGTGLPEVDPPEPSIAFAWTRWWIPLIEPDARSWGLPEGDEAGTDAFSAAVRRHLDSARAWAMVAHEQHNGSSIARMQRAPDVTIQELVHEQEVALGRASRPFRLRIEVLPLAASGIWWIGEDVIAVDEATRDEPILYRDALAPIVAALV